MAASDEAGEHLSDEVLGAYIDQVLSPEDREQASAHLADCASCRAEMLAVRDLKQSAPAGPRRRRYYIAAGAVAAAAALVVVVTRPPVPSAPEHVRTSEPGHSEGVARLEATEPAEGAIVPSDRLQFVWRSRGEDAAYRFTLTSAIGDQLWEESTRDTLVRLPETLMLEPGATYYWIVDVLDRAGRLATTGAQRFAIAR